MKELWFEITQVDSQKDKEALLSLANENADVILENGQAISRNGKEEIAFLADLNEKNIAQLKNEGKKTAIQISH